MAYLMQSYHSKQRGGAPSSYEMLKLATVNGAKTLGREDLGSLQVGKAADLFFIDSNALELAGMLHDPANLLARGGVTGPVNLTMVGGNIVYEDGHFPGLAEEVLAKEAEACCSKSLRDFFPEIFG